MSPPEKSLNSLARLVEAAEAQARKCDDERRLEIAQGIGRLATRKGPDRVVEIDTSGAQAVARRFREQEKERIEQAELIRRTAVAVEKSAAAAADSKQGADAALMWARVAALISLAALLVSAWPYITEWWN